jgi:hypothetical protein
MPNHSAQFEVAMNWEAIGALGQVLGSVAVVATLLYVAREVRQSGRSLSISALRDTTAQWNHWSEMIATSTDLAEIVSKGNKSYDNLSESESLRYGAYVQSFFDNVESYRSLVIDYGMDKDLAVLTSIVSRRIQIPGFKAWWAANTADYADAFASWIDAIRRDA